MRKQMDGVLVMLWWLLAVVDGVEGAAGPPAEAAPWYPAALPGSGHGQPVDMMHGRNCPHGVQR